MARPHLISGGMGSYGMLHDVLDVDKQILRGQSKHHEINIF